jgi:hypothetical protein
LDVLSIKTEKKGPVVWLVAGHEGHGANQKINNPWLTFRATIRPDLVTVSDISILVESP